MTLRRRRNELEYLTLAGDRTDPTEVTSAIKQAREIIDAADRLIPNLGIF